MQTEHFYPRSPCGERPSGCAGCCAWCKFLSTLSLRRATPENHRETAPGPDFYPRSPCGERPTAQGLLPIQPKFLSTLSLRRATELEAWHDEAEQISIHALLAESDRRRCTPPRSGTGFLSTLSLRRATAKVHKTVGHFCAYETNFMGIASSC